MGSVQNSFCFWLKFIKDQFSPEDRLWRDTEAPLLLFTSLISVSETHVQASLWATQSKDQNLDLS